jgi:hypothetical protein
VNLGFSRSDDPVGGYEAMKAKVSDELKQHFRPEFLNRVDEIIVFHQLTTNDIEHIVDLMVAQVESRLRDRDMGIVLTDAAKALVAKRGFDPVLGARPLRRAIQRDIEDIARREDPVRGPASRRDRGGGRCPRGLRAAFHVHRAAAGGPAGSCSGGAQRPRRAGLSLI